MDIKEVELRGRSIVKAMADSEPSSSFIKLLTDLKVSMVPTEEVLRHTKIGVTVNRLRQHSKDPAVVKLASELVTRWKDEVTKAKKKAGAAGGKPAASRPANGAASASTPASGVSSPAPTKRKHNVDPASRNDKTDKINYQLTGIAARDQCVRLIYNGLAFMSEERAYPHRPNSLPFANNC
jgi:transcription elongation factor S-II